MSNRDKENEMMSNAAKRAGELGFRPDTAHKGMSREELSEAVKQIFLCARECLPNVNLAEAVDLRDFIETMDLALPHLRKRLAEIE